MGAYTVKAKFAAAVIAGSLFVPVANASVLTFNFDAEYFSAGGTGDTTNVTDFSAGLVVGQIIHGSFSYDTSSAPFSTSSTSNSNTAYYPATLSFIIPSVTLSSVSAFVSVQDGFDPTSNDVFGVTAQLQQTPPGHLLDFISGVVLAAVPDLYTSTSLPTSLNLSDFDSHFLSLTDTDYSFPGIIQSLGETGAVFIVTDIQPASETPIPAALPLFATGLGVLGLLGWHRKRKRVLIAY